ncbi:hypothetical protein V865_005988 [Kwoniella europaea PYCC6329]|uniref:Fe2OG dioxygenase domain-containing protein n=1 Tax=Kwoniella europaea PYCC6329 TaxID=1423913 RepID=A0AAX4KN54_9TREE
MVVELPLDTKSAIDLYETGEPSSFGRGKELVYDEGYRQAREIKYPRFALSADPLVDSAIPTILMKKLNNTSPSSFRINKMNMYSQGGFFKPHVESLLAYRSTPQGKDHIGTLVLCLPSHFRGGDLAVSHGEATVTFDWRNQVKNGDIAWGFLYSDCKHEVLPVEDGIRITVQYDVFITHTSGLINDRMYDTRSEVVKQAFNRVMDPSFIPEGGELAFGLKYEYPIQNDYRGIDWTALEKVLKGIDAIFMSCLQDTGLHFTSFGVYDAEEMDMNLKTYRSSSSIETDELTPEEKKDVTFHKDIWTADSCHKASGTDLESEDPADLSLERAPDLV